MAIVLSFVHILACILLIGVVLMQKSKGDGLSGAFGGGGALTASFGTRGAATLLSKLTTVFAVVFMLSSFFLALISR
ncbi:MAG: preprotein translocase subunit SecG [Candidatus Fermentibacter sp.]|jgi:preprotein translocase subunit SecG|nr:preprotein translocase subunit SecG [Candidatus Fermentibacter sp.]